MYHYDEVLHYSAERHADRFQFRDEREPDSIPEHAKACEMVWSQLLYEAENE